jgi:biopolymer transport protein ExbD
MPKVVASSPGASGRHQRGRRIGPTLSEINIIPLVDVMLVLLIIFMVAAPMLQKGVEVNLPVASKSADIPEQRLFLDIPLSFAKDSRVIIEKESISITNLPERLRQRFAGKEDQAQVFVRSDADLKVQHLISVFDALKAANVNTAGVVTDLPTR